MLGVEPRHGGQRHQVVVMGRAERLHLFSDLVRLRIRCRARHDKRKADGYKFARGFLGK